MPASDLFHVLRARSSCREPFDPRRPVTTAELQAVLEALRWAPTAHNMQNFEIVAVDDEALLEKIGALSCTVSEEFLRESYAQLAFSEEELSKRRTGLLASSFPPSYLDPSSWRGRHDGTLERSLAELLDGAPLVLFVLADVTRRAPGSAGDALGLVSLGCVLQSAWLAAEALGLSFQVVSALGHAELGPALRQLLGFPLHLEVAFGARLGHPRGAAPPKPRVRREVEDFAHYNGFGHARGGTSLSP